MHIVGSRLRERIKARCRFSEAGGKHIIKHSDHLITILKTMLKIPYYILQWPTMIHNILCYVKIDVSCQYWHILVINPYNFEGLLGYCQFLQTFLNRNAGLDWEDLERGRNATHFDTPKIFFVTWQRMVQNVLPLSWNFPKSQFPVW